MKNLKYLIALIVLTGCNQTFPNSTYVPTPTQTVAAQAPVVPAQTAAPQPGYTPTTTPIVKYDAFDSRSIKVILIKDSQGNTQGTLDLNLMKIGSYNTVVTYENTFVYNSDITNYTTYVGCRSAYLELQDSDTNVHKLTIRQIEQTSENNFIFALAQNDVGAVNPASWFYSATSKCQDIEGEWDLEIERYELSYLTLVRR